MKKNTIVLTILLLLPLLTLQLKAESDLDTVAFWSKVTSLLNNAGYDENSEFGKHARSNLKRVETLHQHAGSATGTAAKAGAVSSWANALGWGSSKSKPRAARAAARKTETAKAKKEPVKEMSEKKPAHKNLAHKEPVHHKKTLKHKKKKQA